MMEYVKIWAFVVIGLYLIRFAIFMAEPFIDLARSEVSLVAWACDQWRCTLRKWGKAFNPLPSFPNCSVDGWSAEKDRESEPCEIEPADMVVVPSHICRSCHRILSPVERSRFTV